MLPPDRPRRSPGHSHQTKVHDNSQLNEHDAVLKPKQGAEQGLLGVGDGSAGPNARTVPDVVGDTRSAGGATIAAGGLGASFTACTAPRRGTSFRPPTRRPGPSSRPARPWWSGSPWVTRARYR